MTCRARTLACQPYDRWLATAVTDAELAEAQRANALFDAHRDHLSVRLPVPDRRGPRCRPRGVRPDDVAGPLNQRPVERVRQEARPERQEARSNRIVGCSISNRMKSRLAVDALDNAGARRIEVAGCILHTGRGSQFQSRRLARALHHHDGVASRGRAGAAGDHAAAQSIVALLQKNVLDCSPWTARQERQLAIVTWIERTYHRRRRQASLGRLSPIEYETLMSTSAAQAV